MTELQTVDLSFACPEDAARCALKGLGKNYLENFKTSQFFNLRFVQSILSVSFII